MPAFSGTVAIWAIKDGKFQPEYFAGTTSGLQDAIDYLAGGKGVVHIGAGTLEITTVISTHPGCHLKGSGMGVTIIKRATGSLLTGDPNYSGNSLLATAYGSNGTPPASVGSALSDITVSDLTLDGNASAFGAVTIAGNNHYGIRFLYVAGVRVYNVEVYEFLQTGIGTDACKNVYMDNIRVYHAGQYATASSKNSIDLNNTKTDSNAAGYNRNYVLTNIISDSPGDEHLMLANVSDVSVNGLVARDGESVIELQGTTSVGAALERISLSGITAQGFIEHFFANAVSTGVALKKISLVGCSGVAGATQNLNAVNISQPGNDQPIFDFLMDNVALSNINAGDAANIDMVSIRGTSSTVSERITIRGCTFSGLQSSTLTSNYGLEVASNVKDLKVVDTTFKYVAGAGVHIHPGASQTVQDSMLRGVMVDTCNADPFVIKENNNTSGAIINLLVDTCSSVDGCRQTGNQCFDVGASSAAGGGSVSYVSFVNCTGRRTSGSNPARGINMNKGAGGTTDNISASGCNFNNLAAPYNNGSVAATNTHFDFPPGRGSDIASAATIAIPTNGSVFHVTGTTNITNGVTVNCWDNGRIVVLIFDGALTMSDTGTSKLSAAYTTTADDTLTLMCDGTNWFEVQRSVN